MEDGINEFENGLGEDKIGTEGYNSVSERILKRKKKKRNSKEGERTENSDSSEKTDAESEFIGSADAAGTGETEHRKYKKHRQSYRKNAKELEEDLEFFSDFFEWTHGGLALLTKSDIWKLDKDEADKLSGAIVAVMAGEDVHIPRKVKGYLKLASAIASIYGPRIYLFREEINEKKRKKVVNINAATQ